MPDFRRWDQACRHVEVTERQAKVASRRVGGATSEVVVPRARRLETDRHVEVGDGLVPVSHLHIDDAAIGVCLGKARGELDSLVQVWQGMLAVATHSVRITTAG